MLRRCLPWLRSLGTLGPVVGALAATIPAQWRRVDVASSPPPRTGFSLLPLATGELLLFGGDSANPAATEWVWNGVAWSPAAIGVPRRDNAATAEFGEGRLLVFGGTDATGFRTDTWRSNDGQQWFTVTWPVNPGVLLDASACSDPAGDRCVMVGLTPSGLWETWFYSVTIGWAPGPVFAAASSRVVADRVRGEATLFLNGGLGAEVWRLAGDAWEPLATAVPNLDVGELAFDPQRGRVEILRPYADRPVAEWDGLNLGPVPQPIGGYVSPARTAMQWHAGRAETVLVANYTNSIELWRRLAQPAPSAFAFGTSCGVNSFRLGLKAGDAPQIGSLHRLEATGPSGSFAVVSALGLSHVHAGGAPLPAAIPIGPAACLLRVDPTILDVIGTGLPATRLVTVPLSPSLLGERYDAQAFEFAANGLLAATNALEVQLGLPLPENAVVESFATNANRDVPTSGDAWTGGSVVQARVGGDGRHGSFDPAFGVNTSPGVYEWSTDSQTIPASATMSGTPATVTDGRFYFTDFVVPAGVTIRFVGSVPAQVFVRGRIQVQGVVSVDAVDMPGVVPTSGPLAGQLVSQFPARAGALLATGQPGGAGNCGGGRGGDGGQECNGLIGPVIIGGVNVCNGQPGATVGVPASHAYAAAAANTGGAGGALVPATGLVANAATPFLPSAIGLAITFRRDFCAGGGGGGFQLAGVSPATPTIPPWPAQPSPPQPAIGPLAAGGQAFPLLPLPTSSPPGYQSLVHFLVGGSGGGGGGAHTFGTSPSITPGETFVAGHGGSGGGGAIALRAGGDVTIVGTVSARGGRGVYITGDDLATPTADITLGASSPGGGGSGGSVLVQGRSIQVTGLIDTSGGAGSRTTNVAMASLAPTQINVQSQAGAGSSGSYRLEYALSSSFTGTGVPAFTSTTNLSVLADRDNRTGSRSVWLLPASLALPTYLRYELLADVNGQLVLFSDDPTVSPISASSATGPVQLRFQGARIDPLTGQALPGTFGPWRSQLVPGADSLNRDRAQTVRFDLVIDSTLGPVVVHELRMLWR